VSAGDAPGVWITKLPAESAGKPRVAVKDLFDTAGVRTTYGSAVFREHVPERTAAAVDRLERAGWTTAGKANLHEFAYGITSHNQHFGDVPNPRLPGLVAGGSSGGSAAALVTGEAELGLGTDSGGSIRIPAACCEVVGFKPSFGLVPMDGCFPLAPSFDHAGPLAADVAGCVAAAQTLAGIEPQSPDDLADLRVGVAWLDRAESAIREVAATAIGAAVPAGRPLDVPDLPSRVFPAFQAEIADVHRELFARHRGLYGRNVATKIQRCLAVTAAEGARARDLRERFREDFARATRDVDVVISPTLPIAPPPASSDEIAVRDRMTELTFPLNAAGAPALALPCGRTRGGAPVSLQVFALPGSDGVVLGAAALLEAALRHTAPSGRSRPAGGDPERGA
jgi:aspartyl-tRNA(Asn)/glutamyl-tRNA(Gln) amidotransferase subunit A